MESGSEVKSEMTSSRSSNTTSPLSMISSSTSEGVVLDQEDVTEAGGDDDGIDFDSSNCSTEYDSETGEDAQNVDGMVLMGSTRLRPAPEVSMDIVSKLKLYTQTFRKLFGRSDCTQTILPLALHGNLHDNPFRSLCWRVFLNVVPSSSDQWVASLTTVRENYKLLVDQFYTAQRLRDSSIDLTINNPLSQDEDSPWNQHFQDTELRKIVQQDVVRVFPELEFFQNNEIREKLSNILFIYARSHPDLSYRQGMHELAAPLLYVIQSDCDTFSALVNNFPTNVEDDLIREAKADLDKTVPGELFNRSYIEADTYSLFEALMEGQLSDWYRTGQSRHDALSKMDRGQPWSRPQDRTTGNMLVSNLNNIHDVLLKRHDPALYTRLEKMEIFPQIYGIRWLRLLFGREFPFRETLVLWDAILADSCPPSLCDQLVVALLMALRDLLLRYEYQDAVQLLMKLPSNLSVLYCTQFALHLKDPIRFRKPTGSAFTCGYSDASIRSKQHSVLGSKKREVRNSQLQSSKSVPSSSRSKLRKQYQQRCMTEPVISEMNSSNIYKKYRVHDDPHSDFTVLDLRKSVDIDNDDDFQDILTDKKSVKETAKSIHFSKKDQSHQNDRKVRSDKRASSHEENHILKDNLEVNLNKLEKLLRQEQNLSRKPEIFHCIGSMKALLNTVTFPSTTANVENGNGGVKSDKQMNDNGRRGKERTTSVAVDVASYFKVEMEKQS